MISQNNHSESSREKREEIGFAKIHRYMVLLSLVCVIGLIPAYSFSQPLAAGKSKFLGAGTSGNIWSKFNSYWNQITPGNDGKWGSVEAARGTFTWTNLDGIYNYAIQNGLLYKHHNLVWVSQQPTWIAGLDSATQRTEVQNWIQLVGQRYPKMDFVDVVNEPFHGNPSYANALGGSGKTGYDWVVTAFTWARQYCAPGVKLLINEYNVIQDNTVTAKYIALIDTLKLRGLIDGIGVQGHYFEFRSHVAATSNIYIYDLSTLKSNLDKLAATGLPIYMSEFDIDEPVDSVQLAQYQVYFPIVWNHSGVKGVTLWGYKEDDVWDQHPQTFLLHILGAERPAMPWLRAFVQLSAPPLLISPNGTTGEQRNARLVFHRSEDAASYHLQVSLSSTFSAAVLDTFVIDTAFSLSPLAANTRFYWHVSVLNDFGEGAYSATANFTTGDQILSVIDPGKIPRTFTLRQNYPNPFNPTTQIGYTVPQAAYVSLKVYNLLGQEVQTLYDGVHQAGNYVATFDGTKLPSGVYVYRLRSDNFVETKKLVLVR